MASPIEKFIISLSDCPNLSQKQFEKAQRAYSKDSQLPFFTNDQLLSTYHKLLIKKTVRPNLMLEKLLTLKLTRSNSGIVVVSVLTKPYQCPGKCIYCPTESGVPKSYLKNEPAVMRAINCKFHPYLQTKLRLQALAAVGHSTAKVNIRIIGGTWSAYTKQYQTWFIKEIFRAANDNDRDKKGERLNELQHQNETARHRIVEISVETRQDYIDKNEILRLRRLGVTKVELGVQSIYDEVLQFNKRGNDDSDTVNATKLLKDAGFKVSYQMMLNLPKSNVELDQKMFYNVFHTSSYQPDHLKIYPLAVIINTGVYKLFKNGNFHPYNLAELTKLIMNIKQQIPQYCRIERVIRDIPSDSIVEGGAKVSNLRQIVIKGLADESKSCKCIRCREVSSNFNEQETPCLFRMDYDASDGKEIFLSMENQNQTKLYSFLRLRIPSSHFSENKPVVGALKNAALIREIHTYGPALEIGEHKLGAAQHRGFGKQLIQIAEEVVKEEFSMTKIAVIAGVGVRQYFEKLGYHLESTYMLKELN